MAALTSLASITVACDLQSLSFSDRVCSGARPTRVFYSRSKFSCRRRKCDGTRRVLAQAAPESNKDAEKDAPSWANLKSEEPPPWAKNEGPQAEKPFEVPFGVYLIASSLVAIATVGSIFEYFNQNAIFGIIQPDSPLWLPILGFFSITGLPSTGFLFYKAISSANKASEEADRQDGFL